MKLSDLLAHVSHSVLLGNTDIEISDVIYDSRKVVKDCVFVCLKGAVTDGHRYAADAIAKGAAALIVSDPVAAEGVTVVQTSDTREALAYISAAYFGNPADELTTIAITGTKGKTTSACMIRNIMEKSGIKTGMIGTLGIVIGERLIKTANTTPESYEIQKAMRQMIDEGCGCVVMEASSLGLKWHRTDGFVFDFGLFTNFSHDHIGGAEHENIEDYRSCKAMLFRQCRHGFFNIDDLSVHYMTDGCTCTVSTFGFAENADYRAANDCLSSEDGLLGVHFDLIGKLSLSIDVDIPGKFNVYNALGALAVCSAAGADEAAILEGLRTVKVKGRVEKVDIPNAKYTLLIDYAHNAVSMESILTILREYHPNRLITVFGAGGNRPRDRRFEMGEISGRLSDLSVITEDNSRLENVMDILADIEVGIRKTTGKYIVIPDRTDAIRWCIENGRAGDIIVLAGKGHEDYQDKGGKKTHYDEREVIAEILKEKNSRYT